MYHNNAGKPYIGDSDLVSCLLRDRLETKLSELYSNRYEAFFDEEAEVLSYEDNTVQALTAIVKQEQNCYYEYKQAWSIWSTMRVDDRLFLLQTFQKHFNQLSKRNSATRNILVFCKVFISEFVPIISTNRN